VIETAVKHGAHSIVFSAIEGQEDILEARDALKKVKGHHVSLIAKI
jgi:pyruvate kinase